MGSVVTIIILIYVWMCLFIYLEQKVYYIVNTLLSPIHRQLSRIKYQHRLFIGVLFQLGPRHFSGKPHITQSKKKKLLKKIKKKNFTQKMFQTIFFLPKEKENLILT